MRRAVGMAGKNGSRHAKHSPQNKHCRQTQPADGLPGTGLKETNSQQLAGLAAKTQPPTKLAGLSPCSAG